MDLKLLADVGIDVDEALSRMMGNQNLFKRMMLKFVDDQTYHNLILSIKEKNQEEIFRNAHTLKGMCANLAIKPLTSLFTKQVELLRNDDLVAAVSLMDEIDREYQAITKVIAEVFNEL